MLRFSLLSIFVLFIAATLATPNAADAEASNGGSLKYIGSIAATQAKRDIGVVNIQLTSYYFLSQNAAGFATAEGDCRAFLGNDATLLCIETQDELTNLTRLLQSSDNTGSIYWVGGKYDRYRTKFVWNSGVEIGPWAPWALGNPNTRLPITRVSLQTVGSPKFRTQFQTDSNRYICELKMGAAEEDAVPCYSDNDLVIVVDSSGSIAQHQYMVALEFTARLASAWADNPGNRLSVIVYSSQVEHIFGLDQNLSVAQIRDLVYGAPYLGSGTASHLSLARALQEFQQNYRPVTKNVVFLTDGDSDNPGLTAVAANNIKAAGIRAFSVGIGYGIIQQELLNIAGGIRERVFNTDGFSELLKLLQPVSMEVCS